MTVEEGHVLNIDGVAGSTGNGTSGGAGSTANKYKPSAGTSATDRAMSGVGQRPSVFQTQVAHAAPGTLPDLEDGDLDKKADGLSVLSGKSDGSKTTSQLEAAKNLPWYRGVTCKDLKDITPTLLILLGGILIMIFVIPYAFTSVIKQLNNVLEMERIQELNKEIARNATLAKEKARIEAERIAAEKAFGSTPDDSETIPDPSQLLGSEPYSEGSDT